MYKLRNNELRMKRLLGLVVFMLSALLAYWALVKLLGYLPKIDPILFAQIIVAHIIVHELCHRVVMKRYRVKAYLFFCSFWAVPRHGPQIRKNERLTWHQKAAIVLAGPVGNVAVSIAALKICSLTKLASAGLFIAIFSVGAYNTVVNK